VIPKVRSYMFGVFENYFVLILSIFSVALKRKFVLWDMPEDRTLLEEDMLRQRGLI